MSKGSELKKINVLIVDDHPIYRNGIRDIVKSISFVKRCDEAANGLFAIEAMENLAYDIVFLDIGMGEMDGVDASRIIKNRFPETMIIVLTMSDSSEEIVELLEIGVQGYMLKNTDADELKRAIQLVMEGNLYLSAAVKDIWSDYLIKKVTFEKHEAGEKNLLTEKQKKIVFLLCQQHTALEIADIIGISDATVNNHRAHIMKKLKIKNSIGIALYAVKSGIFPL